MDFEEVKKLQSISTLNKKKKKFRFNPFGYMFSSLDNDQYLQFGYRKINSFYRFLFTMCETSITTLIRLAVLWFFSVTYISKVSILVINKNMNYNPSREALMGKIDLHFFSQYLYWLDYNGYLINIIAMILVSFFAGSLYHILTPLRKCRTTFVGQVLKFVIVDKKTLEKMTFLQSTARYFCSIIPVIIGILIAKYILETAYYKTLIMSIVISYFFWFDVAPNTLFMGQNISDKICGTICLRKVSVKQK